MKRYPTVGTYLRDREGRLWQVVSHPELNTRYLRLHSVPTGDPTSAHHPPQTVDLFHTIDDVHAETGPLKRTNPPVNT